MCLVREYPLTLKTKEQTLGRCPKPHVRHEAEVQANATLIPEPSTKSQSLQSSKDQAYGGYASLDSFSRSIGLAMDKRTREIKIRLTEEEHQELLVNKNQATLAGWLRDIALKQSPKKPVRTIAPELLYELNKIGVNMNQLAKLADSKLLDSSEKIKLLLVLANIDEKLKGILHNAR